MEPEIEPPRSVWFPVTAAFVAGVVVMLAIGELGDRGERNPTVRARAAPNATASDSDRVPLKAAPRIERPVEGSLADTGGAPADVPALEATPHEEPAVVTPSSPNDRAADQSRDQQPVSSSVAANTPAADGPVVAQPTAKKPTAKKPLARKPLAKKPLAKKPAAKKPSGTKPAKPAAKPAVKKPAEKKRTGIVDPFGG